MNTRMSNLSKIKGQTLRTWSRIVLMVLIITHLVTWYLMGIHIAGSIGIEALFSGLARGVLNAGFVFWMLVFVSAVFVGRAFCGWFCWFGGYLELIEGGMEKTLKRKMPRRVPLFLGAIPFVALMMKMYSSMLVTWLQAFPTRITFQLADTPPWGGQQTGISIVIIAVLYGPVLLLVFGKRAWCRYLCPIGALLKLFGNGCAGKVRLVSDACVGCGQCTRSCPMQVDVMGDLKTHGEVRSSNCIRCLNCTDACPQGAITFSFRRKAASLSVDAAEKAEQASLKRRRHSTFDVAIAAMWIGVTLAINLLGLNQGAPQELKVIMSVGLLLVIYGLVLIAQKAWSGHWKPEQAIQ